MFTEHLFVRLKSNNKRLNYPLTENLFTNENVTRMRVRLMITLQFLQFCSMDDIIYNMECKVHFPFLLNVHYVDDEYYKGSISQSCF